MRRFEMNSKMFDASLPENWCYCVKKNVKHCDQWCDYSHNLFGIPIGMTFPHFLHSPRWQRLVLGMKPNPEIHTPYLDVEPTLGVPTMALIAVQLNIMTDSFSFIPGLNSLPEALLPIAWAKIVRKTENLKKQHLGFAIIGARELFLLQKHATDCKP